MARRSAVRGDDRVARTRSHAASTPKHLDAEIEVDYGPAGGAAYGSFALHLVEHLRNDADIRPAGLDVDEDGFDHAEMLAWVRAQSLEDLVALHATAHSDVCAGCDDDVVAVHSGNHHHPVWFHAASSAIGCADHPGSNARPRRRATAYATVTLSMRLRLPSALGPNPDPGEVEQFFDDMFVKYMIDDHEERYMGDPSEVVDEVVVVSDVSSRPAVS